jgi:cell wall-associated NlpC family hydrolase
MKRIIRKGAAVLLCICLMLSLGSAAFGALMPDVTADMSRPGYWSDLQTDPTALLMTPEEIAAQNAANIAASGTNMFDLKNAPDTINGVSQREALQRSGSADAAYYLGWTFQTDGSKADQAFYDAMIANMADPNASEAQPVRYAVAVNRTTLHTFPSDAQILDDPADPEFDYQHLTGVRVNEPLVIYAESADGAFYLVHSVCCPGWVPAEDVAVCADREEWLSAWDFAPEDTLVVWGTYTTALSIVAPEVSRRLLTQGTTLQRVVLEDRNALVNNRAAYNNHVVWLPVRNDDGSYAKQLCLIAEHAEASVGYLPMTQENIMKAAFAVLGDAYGWGGMMLADDCSGYVRSIYKCFGLELARNTNWQQQMPVLQLNLNGLTDEQKTAAIRRLPLGATLFFSGHEMMYLGCVNDKLYVVSAVSSIMNPDVDGKRQRARDVMINTLDIKRANGNTWLQSLIAADVPYYPADSGVLVPRESEHGTVSFTPMIAPKGTTVTAAPQPDRGYVFRSLTLTDSAGAETTVTDRTFPMPAGVCRVQAAFAPKEFDDVKPGAWYHDAVQWAVVNGVTEGTSETAFSPNANCTRAQAVTFLWRAAGSPAPKTADNPFKDVPDGAYYHDAVLWAVEQKITKGTAADAFSPDAECTRAQIVTFLYRAAMQPETSGDMPFADVPADAYFAAAVRWAVRQNITKGTDGTHFSPAKACTRAEIVTFLQRDAAGQGS